MLQISIAQQKRLQTTRDALALLLQTDRPDADNASSSSGQVLLF